MKFFKLLIHARPTNLTERKPRGEVIGFSKQSQRNFRDTLIRLDLAPFFAENKNVTSNNGFFISLDWPLRAECSIETLNNDLDKLSKRFRREFEDNLLGAIWKKELKLNGTPHVHIIALFNETLEVDMMRQWVRDTWVELVEIYEIYGADVRPLYGNPPQLINYLLKPYSSCEESKNIGRVWGKWNAKSLPIVEPEILGLSIEDYPVFLERLKETPQAEHVKMIRKFNPKWNGGRVLGNGDDLRELLNDLPSGDME
jgi:hypothetical protein